MKTRMLFLAMAASVLVLGCKKDDDAGGGKDAKPFLFNSVAYSTLQEAADVALKWTEYGYATIQLTSNASGDGAVIYSSETGGIIIDFQEFEYDLSPGRSIFIADNYANLTGNGGGIKTSGSAPAIIATDGILYLTGDVNISAETLCQSSSTIVADMTFTGKLSGNVTMEKAPFMVYSSDCQIDIPKLKVRGKDACFCVDAYPSEKTGIIAIGQVSSNQAYPVTTTISDIITVGDGNLHIHNFAEISEPETCSLPARTRLVCPECGFETFKYGNSAEKGSCPASDLIHHEENELTDSSLGNVEYWECPWCGKIYSDAEGKNELTMGATVFPEALFTDRDLLSKYDDIINLYSDEKVTNDPLGVAGLVVGVAALFETAVFSVPGLKDWVNGENAQSFSTIISKLDEIKSTLEDIKGKLTTILKAVKQVPEFVYITGREARINSLEYYTSGYSKEVLTNMKAASVASKEKRTADVEECWTKITNITKDWDQPRLQYGHLYELTVDLLTEYTTKETRSSVPEIYEDIVNDRFLWEHEGYNTRTQFLEYEYSVLDKATAMSYLYLSLVKEFSYAGSRQIELKKLQESFKKYREFHDKEIKYMKQRDSLYRVNVQSNIVYEKSLKSYDFAGWLNKNSTCRIPRNNDGGEAAKTLHKMQSDLGMPGLNQFIDLKQAKVIADYYKNQSQTSNINLYDLLVKNGFKDCPKNYGSEVIFCSQSGWEHEGGDVAQPRYEFFWWYCTRMHNNEDQFGIRSCMTENGEIIREKILENCDIDSHSKGNIQNLGTVKKTKFKTIVNAKNVQKRK